MKSEWKEEQEKIIKFNMNGKELLIMIEKKRVVDDGDTRSRHQRGRRKCLKAADVGRKLSLNIYWITRPEPKD